MAGCGCGSSGATDGSTGPLLSGTLDGRYADDGSSSSIVESGVAGEISTPSVTGLCIPCVIFWVAVVGVLALAWSKRKGESS